MNKMIKLLWIFFLVPMRLVSMELQTSVEGMQEEPEKSHVLSLKHLSARAYAEKYKKLPKKVIPEECIPYVKLYLPITSKSVDEQFALALKLNDEKRFLECKREFLKYHKPLLWEDPTICDEDWQQDRAACLNAKIAKYLGNNDHYNATLNLLYKEDENLVINVACDCIVFKSILFFLGFSVLGGIVKDTIINYLL